MAYINVLILENNNNIIVGVWNVKDESPEEQSANTHKIDKGHINK